MEKNIYQKLANVRVAVQKKAVKKSGKNKYAGFEYFELGDFLPYANEEMAKEGLCAIFSLELREDTLGGQYEIAVLKVMDGVDTIEFSSPTADATVKGAIPIQSLGSKHTYMKRYLYLNCLELVENDVVDAADNTNKDEPKVEKKKDTPEELKAVKDKLNETCKALGKDINEVAKQYKLNGKSTVADIVKVINTLVS